MSSMGYMIPDRHMYQTLPGNYIEITQSDGTGQGPSWTPVRGFFKAADKKAVKHWMWKIGTHLAEKYIGLDQCEH